MNSAWNYDILLYLILFLLLLIANINHQNRQSTDCPSYNLSLIVQTWFLDSDTLRNTFGQGITLRLDWLLYLHNLWADINISVWDIRSDKIAAFFIRQCYIKRELHESFWSSLIFIIYFGRPFLVSNIRDTLISPFVFLRKSILFCLLDPDLHSMLVKRFRL